MDEQRKRIAKLIEALPDSALDELESNLPDYHEFYTASDNYNPKPLKKPATTTLEFDDE